MLPPPNLLTSCVAGMIYFERATTEFRKLLVAEPGLSISPLKFCFDWSWMDKRRILIVDNNDELRAILEEVLGTLGHDVVVTGDREKALAREDLDGFDLIISDLT